MISPKKIGDYNPQDPEKYYGHDFEFRAYVNEVLEGIVREYKDLVGRYPKEELVSSLDSILDYFSKSGEGDEIFKKVMYSISSENEDEGEMDLPHVIHILGLLKVHNPDKWKDFLKMLYSTINEIKSFMDEKYDTVEMTEEKEYKKPRKYSKSYCEKTPCKNMGFTQKASCRPYKNCY
jgi:hypothetical protein